MPKRASRRHRPTWPSASAFHCGSTSTARFRRARPQTENSERTRYCCRDAASRARSRISGSASIHPASDRIRSRSGVRDPDGKSDRCRRAPRTPTPAQRPGDRRYAGCEPFPIHSRPHENGRTTRSWLTATSRRSQAWKTALSILRKSISATARSGRRARRPTDPACGREGPPAARCTAIPTPSCRRGVR